MNSPRRVVLLGGGYVTLHAYARIATRLPRALRRGDVEIVVISPDSCHRYHGFTGELLAGSISPDRVATPLADVLPRARIIAGTAGGVDPFQRVVTYMPSGADGPASLAFDHLVVGTGAHEPTGTVAGLRATGRTLRSPGDIARLADRVRDASSDPVVVIGGGVAGVELAAAIADHGRHVTLVHSRERVLDEWAGRPKLLAYAEQELARARVRTRLGVRAVESDGGEVRLDDGTALPAATVVATIGASPVVVPGLDGARDDRGRLRTAPDLSVVPGIWAGGDAARVAHPVTGELVPANALWAMKQGDHIGRTVARALRGRPARAFGYRGLGRAAAFGVGHGITEIYGIGLRGWPAWLLRLGFFLRFMPSRRRAAGVVADLLRASRTAVRPGADGSSRSALSATGEGAAS